VRERGSDMRAERDAMGADEYHPISHKGSNLTEAGGVGYTVVDALDTMLIMGLDAEYLRARDWIEHKLSFERDADFNTFEVRADSLRRIARAGLFHSD
jgi:endoplasmic reticulum Man9GlcNAc2 1,2-alpha-mannosidase